MRLPYVPADPTPSDPDDAAVVERVKARRGGTLIPLDRALLHAPPVADGWNGFLGAVRTRTTLPASIREIAICRVAALNSAWFEWEAHAPILRKALAEDSSEGKGMSGSQSEKDVVEELKDTSRVADQLAGWDDRHCAVVAYTDAMTRTVIVPEPIFKKLRSHFSEREVVEITATIAAYNCVSRFLVALDVGEMAEKYNVDMS